MVIAFPADVLGRLQRIEEAEGIPVAEVVHQAVAVWSQLDADGRRILGIAAMQIVVDGLRKGGAR